MVCHCSVCSNHFYDNVCIARIRCECKKIVSDLGMLIDMFDVDVLFTENNTCFLGLIDAAFCDTNLLFQYQSFFDDQHFFQDWYDQRIASWRVPITPSIGRPIVVRSTVTSSRKTGYSTTSSRSSTRLLTRTPPRSTVRVPTRTSS